MSTRVETADYRPVNLPRLPDHPSADWRFALPGVDNKRRIGLGKLARKLGWHPEQMVWIARAPVGFCVFSKQGPGQPLLLDEDRRLLLPPPVRTGLGAGVGAQVLAAADLVSHRLWLLPVSVVVEKTVAGL